MVAYLNRCAFVPFAYTDADDFEVDVAATGFYIPASCFHPGVPDGGATYNYFAVSADGTEHEEGVGVYNDSISTLTRTMVRNSSNLLAKVTFTAPPTVYMGGPTANDAAFGGSEEITTDNTTPAEVSLDVMNTNVTSDGSGLEQTIALPPLTISDTGRRHTINFKTQTDPGDTLRITGCTPGDFVVVTAGAYLLVQWAGQSGWVVEDSYGGTFDGPDNNYPLINAVSKFGNQFLGPLDFGDFYNTFDQVTIAGGSGMTDPGFFLTKITSDGSAGPQTITLDSYPADESAGRPHILKFENQVDPGDTIEVAANPSVVGSEVITLPVVGAWVLLELTSDGWLVTSYGGGATSSVTGDKVLTRADTGALSWADGGGGGGGSDSIWEQVSSTAVTNDASISSGSFDATLYSEIIVRLSGNLDVTSDPPTSINGYLDDGSSVHGFGCGIAGSGGFVEMSTTLIGHPTALMLSKTIFTDTGEFNGTENSLTVGLTSSVAVSFDAADDMSNPVVFTSAQLVIYGLRKEPTSGGGGGGGGGMLWEVIDDIDVSAVGPLAEISMEFDPSLYLQVTMVWTKLLSSPGVSEAFGLNIYDADDNNVESFYNDDIASDSGSEGLLGMVHFYAPGQNTAAHQIIMKSPVGGGTFGDQTAFQGPTQQGVGPAAKVVLNFIDDNDSSVLNAVSGSVTMYGLRKTGGGGGGGPTSEDITTDNTTTATVNPAVETTNVTTDGSGLEQWLDVSGLPPGHVHVVKLVTQGDPSDVLRVIGMQPDDALLSAAGIEYVVVQDGRTTGGLFTFDEVVSEYPKVWATSFAGEPQFLAPSDYSDYYNTYENVTIEGGAGEADAGVYQTIITSDGSGSSQTITLGTPDLPKQYGFPHLFVFQTQTDGGDTVVIAADSGIVGGEVITLATVGAWVLLELAANGWLVKSFGGGATTNVVGSRTLQLSDTGELSWVTV